MALNDGYSDVTGLRVAGVPTIGSGPQLPVTTGNYFFVNGNGLGNSAPALTYNSIADALAQCVSGRGDVIIVQPGYTEAVGAAGLAINKNGVSIIGLGNRSQRPSFSFGATAATIAISGSGVLISNFSSTCSVDEIVTAFTITGASCTFDNVSYIDTSTFQLIQFALVTGTRFVMQNCYHYQSTAAATAAYWVSLGGADRSEILNNYFHLTMPNSASSAVIGSVATAPLGIHIKGNDIYLAGGTTIASAILLVASTTGLVTYNNAYISATSQVGTFALASAAGAVNLTTNVVNKSGILDPAADT